VQFATELINRTTLNNKLKMEKPTLKFVKSRMRKRDRVEALVRHAFTVFTISSEKSFKSFSL
jgi:hypothetical protein